MEWIEIASSDVATAKRIALEELGVREQEAEFEILAEEKVGLFWKAQKRGAGQGAGQAAPSKTPPEQKSKKFKRKLQKFKWQIQRQQG